jgi:N-acetylglucosaminyldiphosphoundecaprenol N-acetyl-beta-D-mannosaminyltransferase
MDVEPDVTEHDDLSREVYCVLGIPIDAIEMSTVLRRIDAAAEMGIRFLISTSNINYLVTSQVDPEFRDSLLLSDLCPPDGMPIVWIARLFGARIRGRIAGSDIFDALKARLNVRTLTILLFGSTEPIAAEAAKRLNLKPSGVRCVGWICPGFVDVNELSRDQIIDQINDSNADFLVAALGARKGQLWLQRNHSRLRIPIRAHLGATINFQAGAVKRAPLAMQKLGLEWLWRIKEEPSLFARYWHDGHVLLRILLTRVIPLMVNTRLQNLRRNPARHDFVIVPNDNGAVVTVRISGDATAEGVPKAISCFRQALATQKSLVIDLTHTRTVDSRFFGLFLMVRKQLKSSGSLIQFVGVPPAVVRQFRLNGVEYLL